MRFLIVNGYNATPTNAKAFAQFRQWIKKIIVGMSDMADTECEYYVRDRHQLDDFLYEPETSLIRLEGGLKFDSIDMVFISAAPNIRPWSQSTRKLITLIRMCIKTKKLLFVNSFGTQALAFLCSSNINVHINVTNNNGDGCKLVEFPKFTLQALMNGHEDYFLDSATGDLYSYAKPTDEWIPKANVGLHYRRDAMEYQSIGRFVVKSPTYRPKQPVIDFETLCTVKKQFLHHWLFKDVHSEFAVALLNSWDIHAITFTNPERKFMVLAENNQRGPLILECENIIGIMFELEINKKDTLRILSNFIDNGLKIIKFSNDYNSISITNERFFNLSSPLDNIEIIYQGKSKSSHNANPEELKKQQQKSFQIEYRNLLNKAIQETTKDKIFHVGYSVKKDRLPDYVQQNNIAQKHFKVLRGKSFLMNKEKLLKQFKISLETNPSSKKLSTDIQHPQSMSSHRAKRTEILRQTSNKSNLNIEDEEGINKTTLTQAVVRKTLHPTLGEQYLGDKKIWIPGFLNTRTKLEQQEISDDRRTRASMLNLMQ